MNTEIYIEGSPLDVTKDISTLLNFAIDDVRDFASRSTAYSKTIVLPGTSNNNKLFGHIFNIGQSNIYDESLGNIGYNFNASKSADCIIFQDQVQTFMGNLRLMEIDISKGNIEYEVAVFGTLSGLNVALSGALLETLDFSGYDHVFDETTVVNSWDNTPGTGYYYPLIDYGTYSINKHDWNILTFRPALYVREYLYKMFTAAGYRFESALFDTARFKGLIIPYSQKVLTRPASRILNLEVTTPVLVISFGTSNLQDIPFDVFSSSVFTNLSGTTRFQYNQTNTVTVTMNYDFTGVYNANGTTITLYVQKNAANIATETKTLNGTGPVTVPFHWFGSFSITLTLNDIIEFYVVCNNATVPYSLTVNTAIATLDSASAIPVPVIPGDTVTVNSTVPKNIKQIDFLVAIVKLFNLYVYEDRFDNRLIYLKPYVDFYSTDSANSVDWTYKLNRDKTVKIKPMSEINAKKYEFKFKSDSDFYNELYRKRYSQGYGDHVFTSGFEFAEQTKSFEIVFSATPLVGYGSEDKVYPTIFKQSNLVEEQVDSNIRILQSKKITGVSSWDITAPITLAVLTSSLNYGYAGHLDDPDAPTNDLNFGALNEIFFVLLSGDLSVTQFNVYYSGYMAEITDKDSKLLSGTFYLTSKDIFELDFSKFIYLDGVLFRLVKIEDYNMSKPMDCRVELLKVNYLIY